MLSFLCQIFILSGSLFVADVGKKAEHSLISEIENQEYIGSIDLDDDGNIVFYHFPAGPVKPAIIFMHKMTFQKRSDRFKAINYLDKNVKVIGSIIKIDDLEIILVEKLEILKLEI